jgi:hypothetical protein
MKSSNNATGRKVVTARTAAIFAILVVVIGYGAYKYAKRDAAPDPRVAFGQCLTDKGAKFYGAFWCPHCSAQKKLLGKGFKKVTYVECGVPGDNRAQMPECKEAKIEGYPTWTFADGSRVSGEQRLEDLAEKTGCELPATN